MTITVVLGPPCGGKSTFVQENAAAGDVRIDFDLLAQSFGADVEHDAPDAIRSVAFAARDAAISVVLNGVDVDAWIIHTQPRADQIAAYEAVGAQFETCDPGMDECLSRAATSDRPERNTQAITDWYTATEAKGVNIMNVIRKDATITNTDDAFPGEFEVILSAPTKDRDGETLLADEWKQPLPDRITFDADHGMSVASTVGSGVPTLNDAGELKVAGTYSSLARAQEVRTLVNEGHIRTTSVAFMTEKSPQKDGKGTVTRELLNGAFVAVPSNREALVLSSKGMKTGARNSASDAEHIQAMHDHTAALGAACPTPAKSVRTVTLKSVDGSLEATQDRARDALNDAYPGVYTYLRATVPSGDAGGTLVFAVEDKDTYDSESFKQDYTDDGSVITLVGERSAVDLVEVIKPDPDESTEPSAAADENDALDVQNRALQAQVNAYVTE